MRKGISITVTPADWVRLDAIVRDRNSPQKHVWRARIVLLPSARSHPARAADEEGALRRTTTLFAALNVLEGKVIGRCMQRHRHQECRRT